MSDLAQTYRIRARISPFERDFNIDVYLPFGTTLGQALDHVLPDPTYRDFVVVSLGHDHIYPFLYDQIKPKIGTEIFIKVVPEGPAVGALAAALAGAAASAYVGSLTAVTALGAFQAALVAGIAGAVVSVAVGFAFSALAAPSAPDRAISARSGRSEAESPTFNISGARNDIRQYQPIPQVLGQHKMVPPYGAAPYTEIVGNDQYLRFVVLWGYGPVQVDDIRIGNTPLDRFEDVEVEHDFDGSLDSLTLYPSAVYQEDLGIVLAGAEQRNQSVGLGVGSGGVVQVLDGPSTQIQARFSLSPDSHIVEKTSHIDFRPRRVRAYRRVTVTGYYRLQGNDSWVFWFSKQYQPQSQITKAFTKSGLPNGIYEIRLIKSGEPGVTWSSASWWEAQYQTRTTAQNIDEFGITITWPRGLYQADGQVRLNRSMVITAEFRAIDGDWQPWFSETFRDNTGEAKRISRRQMAPARGQYEIRLSRSQEFTNALIIDETAWTALRSFTNEDPVKIAGVAKSAFRIKASDQLNGVVDELNGIVSFVTPIWNGADWTGLAGSRNPAAVFRHVLTGVANKRALDIDRIDNIGLGDWYEFCEAEGFKYDSVIDYRTSVRDLLQDIASAGRATPTLIDDLWSVIIDRPRDTIDQMFTPRNTANFSSTIRMPDIPHGYRIRFLNAEKGHVEDERIVHDDGYDETNAIDFEVLELAGQTEPDNVYKLGRYYLAALRLRAETFTFETDIRHITCRRGSVILFNHDVALIGLATGRIKSVSNQMVYLDEPVTIPDQQRYILRVQRQDNTTHEYQIESGIGLHGSLTLDTFEGLSPGDLWTFGVFEQDTLPLIVSSIEGNDDLGATITGVPYDEAVYRAADIIPPYDSVISDPISVSFRGPPAPSITQIISDESAMTRTSSGALEYAIIVYVQAGQSMAGNGQVRPATALQARYRRSGSEEPYKYLPQQTSDVRSFEIRPVIANQAYDIQVQAINDIGGTSAYATVANHMVAGATARPPALETFTASANGSQTYLEWTYPDMPVDVVAFEIRYSPAINETGWQHMTVIADSVSRETRAITLPTRTGTYGIKAVDVIGNRSEQALFINTSSLDPGDFNVIERFIEHPNFDGLNSLDIDRVNGALQLSSNSVLADWGRLSDVQNMTYGTGQGFVSDGYYEFGEIDLGDIYTCRVSAHLDVSSLDMLNVMASWETLASLDTLAGRASGDDTSVTIYVATSQDQTDTPTFGPWQRFVIGDFTARHFKFRVALTTTKHSISPLIRGLQVDLDMPDRVVSDNDNDVINGTADVVFDSAFWAVKSVNITAQNMQAGDTFEVTEKSETGFRVTFKDSNLNPIDRSFDYQAIGYGRHHN